MKRLIVVFISALLWTSFSNAKTLHFTIAPRDAKHIEVIKDAASVLMQQCPTVNASYVESVEAHYSSDTGVEYKLLNPDATNWDDQKRDYSKPYTVKGLLGYKSKNYGWNYDVEFQVKDTRSGHTHWLDVGGVDGKITGFLVQGKQVSLDFCKINETMHDNYYQPLSVQY